MKFKASPAVWVSFAMVVGVMGTALISPLYALYQQAWQLKASDVSLLYVIYMGGALCALLFAGRLPDRLGFRPMMQAGLVLAFVGTLMSLYAWNLASLCLARFVVGVSSSIVMTSATAGYARLSGSANVQRMAMVNSFLLAFGFGLGPLVGGAIGQWAPRPLVLAYVPTLVLCALALVALRRLPLPPSAQARVAAPLHWRELLPRLTGPAPGLGRAFVLTCCLPFLAFGVFGLYASMAPLFLDRLVPWHGPAVSGSAIALILMASAAVQVLAARLPTHWCGLWGLLALAACNAVLMFNLQAGSALLFALGVALTAIGHALSMLAGMSLVNRLAPPEQRSSLLSTYMVVGYVGSMVPMMAIGWIADHWGLDVGVRSFCVAVVVIGLSAAVVFPRDPHIRPPVDAPPRRAAAPAAPALPQAPRAPLWLLVLVTLSGTMAMHIFVPALPVAGQALGASAASMQQTITLYVLGLAVGQLVYGPVSDALGRRPTLLIGLTIYFTASVMALFAPTLEWLVAARLLQALGGAAGITLGRAIVRDMADPARATKDIALLNLLTLVGPGLSPIVGSYLADQFGWRSVYVFLVAIGSAMLLFTHRLLPETHPHRRPLQVRGIAADYRRLLGHPKFLGYMLGGASVTTALYPYVASVSYIVHTQMGLAIRHVGWFAATTIVGASIGTLITRRLSGRWPPERMLYAGAGLALTMSLTLLVVYRLGALTPAALLAITATLTLGAGLASPAALASAMSVIPSLTGSAAGIYGFGQMAMGAIGTWVVGFGDDPTQSCATTQIGLTTLACASFWFAHRQAQRDDSPAASGATLEHVRR